MGVSEAQGWIFAFIGIIFWGLFAAPMKFPRVIAAELHPMVFQWYMSIAIALSSLVVLPGNDFAWTSYALLGAGLWTVGNQCAIYAVSKIGIGPAQCIWAGLICIISFLWGVLGNHIWTDCSCALKSTPLAVVGLAIVVAGIVAIVMVTSSTCGGLLPFPDPEEDAQAESESNDLYSGLTEGLTTDAETATTTGDRNSVQPRRSGMRKSSSQASFSALPAFSGSFHSSFAEDDGGVEEEAKDKETTEQVNRFPVEGPLAALCTAILAGSCLVPVSLNGKYGPESTHEILYAVSFGFSSFIVATALVLGHMAGSTMGLLTPLKFSTDPWVVLPCMLSGLLWNTGNIMSDLVTISPLGLTIGYPVMQTALIIGGLTGIFVFKEIQGIMRIVAFLAASSLTAVGAVVLGMFGACADCS